jgi:hypothetical protein
VVEVAGGTEFDGSMELFDDHLEVKNLRAIYAVTDVYHSLSTVPY